MTESLIIQRPSDGVLSLRLNRPQQRNAINEELLDALWRELRNPLEPVVVISSHDPSGCFCAGGDLSLDPRVLSSVSDSLFELYAHIVTLGNIVIAVADGPVVGAGLQLYLAADLRVAGHALSLRNGGIQHGFVGTTWALPSLVGRGAALRFILDEHWIGADEAASIGLADFLETAPEKAALDLAARVAGYEPRLLRQAKRAIVGASLNPTLIWAEQAANRDVPLRWRDGG